MNSATARATGQLFAVLAVLAAAGVLAVVTNTLSGTTVYALVAVIAGGTAVAGGLALTAQPANMVPHLVLIAAVLGLVIAMAAEHVFAAAEVTGVFGFIVGGGTLGAGSTIVNTKLLLAAQHHPAPAASNVVEVSPGVVRMTAPTPSAPDGPPDPTVHSPLR